MATWVILFALAITSNQYSIRKLKRRWQSLHRLAYAAAIGGVIHFWWLVKADVTEPRRWAMGATVLLGIRLWWAARKRQLFIKSGKTSPAAPLS
jgi:sulfoxide reductase heme-binding subunit YedZ